MKLTVLLAFIILSNFVSSQTVLTQMPKPDNNVWAMAKHGNIVYIGGSFTNINGSAKAYLASFDCTTGALTSWNPIVDSKVYGLAIAGGKLMVAGEFGTVNGSARKGFCMFDLTTGNLDSWNPGNFGNYLGQSVGTLNNNFFFCGSTGSGSGYNRIYCLDATTGQYVWMSNDSTTDNADGLVASGNYVWTGEATLHRYNINTGVADTWSPALSSSGFIKEIVAIDSVVYIGGSYTTIGGQTRRGLSAYDDAGNLLSFTIQSSSTQVWSLFPDGNYLWVGGNSSSYGGQSRYRMAQFEIATQQVTCWNPSSFSSGWSFVNSILVSNDTVYAGPGFPSSANDYLTVSKATCIGNGIEENVFSTLNIFPNPSNNKFHLDLSKYSGIVNVAIYDILGNEIFHDNIIPQSNYSFGENLIKGIYLLKLKHDDKFVTFRLIKQ